MSIRRSITRRGFQSALFLFASAAIAAFATARSFAVCPFGVSGQSGPSTYSDALLLLRYATGGRSSTLTANSGALGTPEPIEQAILSNRHPLDVDSSGRFDSNDAHIVAKYLAGFRGSALDSPVLGAGRRMGTDIATYISGGCNLPPPPSYCPALDSSDLVAPATEAPRCTTATTSTHSYGPHAENVLDLHRPATGNGPFPTVIWIHGGGWRQGTKAQVEQARRLACRGYAVASINYRLTATNNFFPTQIHDVKAAIRFLRANATNVDFNLDPNRFATFGSSAGGHLAALAATSDGVIDLEDLNMGNAETSSAVQASAAWYGPSDFSLMDSQIAAQGCAPGNIGHSLANSAESILINCTVGDPACASAVRRANPVTYITNRTVPIYLMHGTTDCTVPGGQSAVVKAAMDQAGRCSVYRKVVGAGHGGIIWQSEPVQNAVSEFFDALLKTP